MKTIFKFSTLLLVVGAIVTGCGSGSGSNNGTAVAAAAYTCPSGGSLTSQNGIMECCGGTTGYSGYGGVGYGGSGYGAGCTPALTSGATSAANGQMCQESGGTIANFGNGQYGCCPAGVYISPATTPIATAEAECPVMANPYPL